MTPGEGEPSRRKGGEPAGGQASTNAGPGDVEAIVQPWARNRREDQYTFGLDIFWN